MMHAAMQLPVHILIGQLPSQAVKVNFAEACRPVNAHDMICFCVCSGDEVKVCVQSGLGGCGKQVDCVCYCT